MIHYINGELAIKGDGYIVVETGGIGYTVYVPLNSRFYLKEIGENIRVFTAMTVREDDISLYGFEDHKTLEIFNKLITVNGIGAKAAMAIFSALTVEEIKKAIVFEDATMLTRANGIGKKTAQRIILDLKDKFEDLNISSDANHDDIRTVNINISTKNEAMNALMELGYTRAEAQSAVDNVADDNLTVEDYIKKALMSF